MQSNAALFSAAQTKAVILSVAKTLKQLEGTLSAADISRLNLCNDALIRAAVHLGCDDESASSSAVLDWISEANVLEELEAEFASIRAEAGSASHLSAVRAFDERPLLDYLRRHPLGSKDLEFGRAQPLLGGRSKQTVLLELRNAGSLPSSCVLRKDWSESSTGTSVLDEYGLVERLYDLGLAVPQPVLKEGRVEILGDPFIIVNKVSGQSIGDPFVAPDDRALILDLASHLGRLHGLDVSSFRGLSGMKEDNTTQESISKNLQDFRAAILQAGPLSYVIEVALNWLTDNLPGVKREIAIVHGDLGFHNVLCENGRVSAILDWELSYIGHPAFDLGYLRSTVSHRLDWNEFYSAYISAGGRETSPETLDFFTLFSSIWLYQLFLKARMAVSAGLVSDIDVVHACAHYLPALAARISRQVKGIVG